MSYQTDNSLTRPSERVLGTLSYQEDAVSSPKRVHLYKISKGYALKGNIDRSDNYESNLMLSKDKEYDWFAGLKWRWTF